MFSVPALLKAEQKLMSAAAPSEQGGGFGVSQKGQVDRSPACTNSKSAHGIAFLRGKSHAGAGDPSRGGSSNIPSSLTPSRPASSWKEWEDNQRMMRRNDPDYWLTPAGQADLQCIEADRKCKALGPLGSGPLRSSSGMFIFDYSSSTKAHLSPVSASAEWQEVELTADTGACDTVIPKAIR